MKTTTLKTKAMSILLVLAMCFSMLPISAFAADTKPSYVALGDSISTGYGLADKTTQGFTKLLADSLGYELTNLAVDGNTAAGVLAQLQTDAVKTAVTNADLITITAGGNDLMAMLYQAIADQYNATQTDEANHITATEVPGILSSTNDSRKMSLMNFAMGLLNPEADIYLIDDPEFAEAVTAYIATLNQITAGILAVNSDATIIVATQYNPYVEFNGALYASIINLTPIYQGMEAGVAALNTAIKNNTATGGYTVADVKAAFDSAYSATNDLYVADPATLEFDFHPTAAGHYVFADTTLYAIWEKLPTDAPTLSARDGLTLTYKDYTDQQISVIVTDPKEGYTYSYQWYDASTDQTISGATNAAYTIPNDLAAGSYSYYCVATAKPDDNGQTQSSKSSAIAVTVNKATLTADDFEFEGPADLVYHPANSKTATVTPKDGVTGIGNITIQYIKDGQTISSPYNAGRYTVKIHVAEGANYLAAEGLTANSWTFTIEKGRQNAPSGIVGVAETVYGKNDGEITNVDNTMEYRKAGETDADYKAITGTEITGLAAGTYDVRMKETENLLASAPATVTIAAGRKLTITVPSATEQIGYTIEADASCAYGATVEIKITALEGYGRDENFDVYNNGNLVSNQYHSATGILTLENVTEDVSITLANGSFVDRTKPTAEITLGTNKWNTFWNNLTFGLFFKETQTVTIKADDKGSGLDKVYFYISADEMERSDVLSITAWQEYTGAFNIDPDCEAVIYVKAVDKAGNLWLVNSDGLVLDATAPTLEGIENGKTYYGDLTVIIPADQFGDIEQVTLDGKTMIFAEGTYGRIPADNKEHTVVATDKAGNKTVYKITVYKNYTVDIGDCHYVGCTISGGGSYQHGQTVTLTATPADGTKFAYWLDTSIELSDEPTEAELRAAIVSYDKTYTFTAKKDVSLEAVFSGSEEIGITAMLIAGTDEKSLLDAEWMDDEYDFGTVTPGAEQIVLPGEIIEDAVTIGDKHYKFAGFITFGYDEATETETAELKETLTIDAMPLYNSAEYWNWIASISDGLYVAYMEYTPEEPENPSDPEAPEEPSDPEAPEEPSNPETPEEPSDPEAPEEPSDPETPEEPSDPEAPEDPQKPSSPQTGDNSSMALWFALLFISSGAIITLTVYDRKKRTVNNK